AVPAIAVAVMVRRGAPLTPHLTAALGGLAAAGLGNFGLRFFHPQDASLMVLVWQFGTGFILSAFSSWAGRYLLYLRPVLRGPAGRRLSKRGSNYAASPPSRSEGNIEYGDAAWPRPCLPADRAGRPTRPCSQRRCGGSRNLAGGVAAHGFFQARRTAHRDQV